MKKIVCLTVVLFGFLIVHAGEQLPHLQRTYTSINALDFLMLGQFDSDSILQGYDLYWKEIQTQKGNSYVAERQASITRKKYGDAFELVAKELYINLVWSSLGRFFPSANDLLQKQAEAAAEQILNGKEKK